MKPLNQKGFTLIEFLIAITVIVLLIGISLISYRFFEKGTELENTAQNILATLKLAQTKTLSSEEASQYGVRFENNKYILFKGETYLEGAVDNKVYQLPIRLEIYNIDLFGGASSTVFQRISGMTDQSGTIDLRITSQPTRSKTISIQSSGQIDLEAGLDECCTTNRLTDSRHLHLDLGWSIQSSVILTLYFPDTPEKTVDINMADYFNPDKTEFDWAEVIDVNGQNQELRIHTHFLDEFNTILCLHRARDKNNKPLQVLIDAKDIISYTAEGEISIGTYGGTVEIQ
jgi:prepilin-type N-terminal cleavage/methylation domain-containing protein